MYYQIWNTYKQFMTPTRLKESLHLFDTTKVKRRIHPSQSTLQKLKLMV